MNLIQFDWLLAVGNKQKVNPIKTEWLVPIGILIGISSVIYFLVKNHEKTSKSELDKWFEQRLAKALAEKLHESPEDILKSLENNSSDELTGKIHEIVDFAQLTFTRTSSTSNVDIQLNLDYKNGTSFSVTTNWDWDQLPEPIRSEFLRTGKNVVTRPWLFSWDSSSTS